MLTQTLSPIPKIEDVPVNQKMRFHVLALPHTVTHKEYNCCAYSMKVLNLCKMLMHLGHEVIHYGTEGSVVECTEHVTVVDKKTLINCYGDYDWKKTFFKHNISDLANSTFNKNAIIEIQKRKQSKDFLLCHWGIGHQSIAETVGKDMLVVEPGIGYDNIFANFKVFESYSWMHTVYGMKSVNHGSWYDAVIPNYFDPDDFQFSNEKENYYVYLGRFIYQKGLTIAIETTQRLGVKLIVAGQGDLREAVGNIDISHVENIGHVNVQQRNALVSKAKASFVPTLYLEPFGGVAVESMMQGTPVITSDWGAFTETVLHGLTGYRCKTMEQFCWAAENIESINPFICRNWAIQNYSLGAVARMYQEYFEQLYRLWESGWYSINQDRKNLDWLVKRYPV